MKNVSIVLALSVMGIGACGGDGYDGTEGEFSAASNRTIDGEMTPNEARQLISDPPKLRAALNINCKNLCYNLDPNDSCTPFNSPKARVLYDKYFESRFPKNETDFGWHVDEDIASLAHLKEMPLFTLPGNIQPSGAPTAHWALFDWNPKNNAVINYVGKTHQIQRNTTSSNHTLLANLPWSYPNGFSYRTQADRFTPYTNFNPHDYLPVTLTYYTRIPQGKTDVMADQFVVGAACENNAVQKSLARCPDCDDVFVALSRYDLYKVFEVRFLRVSPTNRRQLEVSRVFKLLSVDSSHDLRSHAYRDLYKFGVMTGTTLKARWRGEMSGKMHQMVKPMVNSGYQVTGAMMRLSENNEPYTITY